MQTALVTGASGFIGSNLTLRLLDKGYHVRVFYRKNSDFSSISKLNVEHYCGDILDEESLVSAMKGSDVVFHTAAIVAFWKGRKTEQIRTNVEGSRNIVNACLKTGIKRLIHTSSVAALGFSTDGKLINEETTYNWGTENLYRYTKHLAELEILNGVEKGLDAVIVNPSIVIGPGDRHVHGGRLIIEVKSGRVRFYTSGGTNVVSVHDVVNGHILAAEKGRTGERYILSDWNCTHKELLNLIAEVVNGKKKFIKIPRYIVTIAGRLFDIVGTLTNSEPPLTSQLAKSIVQCNWYTYAKAERELGYKPTSIKDAIAEAFEWYKKNNII